MQPPYKGTLCGYTLYAHISTQIQCNTTATWSNGTGEEPAGGCGTTGCCQSPPHAVPLQHAPFPGDFLRAVGWRGGERTSLALWVIVIEERRRHNEKHFSHHPPLLCHPPSILSPSLVPFLCSVIITQIIIRLTLPSLRWRGGPAAHMALVRDFSGSAGGGGRKTKTRGPIKSI